MFLMRIFLRRFNNPVEPTDHVTTSSASISICWPDAKHLYARVVSLTRHTQIKIKGHRTIPLTSHTPIAVATRSRIHWHSIQ